MFDLKKRHSMILKEASHDTEEFRRVALRRRSRSAADDCASHTVSSGSYRHSGAALDHRSPQKRVLNHGALLKPQVLSKPVHLQTPDKASQQKDLTPQNLKPPSVASPAASQCPIGEGKRTTGQRTQAAVLLQVIPAWYPITSKSLAGTGSSGAGSRGVNNTSISPVRRSDGTTLLGTPSPALRGAQRGSPLRRGGGPGGHSNPTSLSPRDIAHKQAKHRTPSPTLWTTRSHSLFKRSRSWVSQQRTANSRMDEPVGHSSDAPQLAVHLAGSSPTVDTPERSCKRMYCTTSASVSSHKSEGLPADPPPGPVVQGPEQQAGASPELTHHGGEAQEVSGEGGFQLASERDMTIEERRTQEDVDQRMDVEKEEEEKRDSGGGEASKRKQKLYNIATELLMTERAYVARLHLLDQVFCSRLSEEASRGSFKVDVVKRIFSNISAIYSFHSQFLLPDLEKRMLHWLSQPGLGDILLRHAPFLRMYSEYVGNFEEAMSLLRIWKERSATFRTILQDIQSQEVCGRLTLENHMLEPVQRVPRYEMLLKDYLSKLPEDDPDYPLAHQALETISMAAGHANSAIHRAEHLKKLLEIFEMVGEEEILKPSSEFLREGRLLKLAARNTAAMDRYLFLFNNFLLCCKLSMVGQRCAVRTRIGVEGMQVQKTTNEDHPYSFQISGKEKTLELEASSEKDRDDWIMVIQEAIDVFHKKNESLMLASMNISEEELGRRAPRWIRDNEVVVCMKCQEAFNVITRRRHHCRACGCVVCWKCSEHKVALEYDGYRLNKVCNACYGVLSGRDTTGLSLVETVRLAMASSRAMMSSFLTYGDDPMACRRVWSVIPQSQPFTLHLYPTQQEPSPLLSIPLLGSSVEASPHLSAELQDPWRFCLVHATSRHTFLCDSLELKQRWVAVLREAGTAGANPLASSLAGSQGNATNSMAFGVAMGRWRLR